MNVIRRFTNEADGPRRESFAVAFPLPRFIKTCPGTVNKLTASILFIIGYLNLAVIAVSTLAAVNIAVGNLYSHIHNYRNRFTAVHSDFHLFDDWAAWEESGFRKYYHKSVSRELKTRGKAVIAVSRDELNFVAADRIIRMDNGRIESQS